MHRIDRPLHSAPRPYARAVDIRYHEPRIPLPVAYVLASTIIVLWISYLSVAAGSVATQRNTVPQHLTSVNSIDRVYKGNRLDRKLFIDRWNATAGIIEASPETQGVKRVPEACQPAFKHRVKVGSLSDQCVNAPTRLAAVK